MKYKIVRYYAPHVDKENEEIKNGLTLDEAKEHCSREDTHCAD